MKAILEFELPDDQERFNSAVNCDKLLGSLCELKTLLRNRIKYWHDQNTTYAEVNELFLCIVQENEIAFLI